jgi:hypothetical protein
VPETVKDQIYPSKAEVVAQQPEIPAKFYQTGPHFKDPVPVIPGALQFPSHILHLRFVLGHLSDPADKEVCLGQELPDIAEMVRDKFRYLHKQSEMRIALKKAAINKPHIPEGFPARRI